MPAKHIIRDEEAQKALLSGIEAIAKAVSLTLGPRGQNVILEKKDRKSTRLNSSHKPISYAVFCFKKKKK